MPGLYPPQARKPALTLFAQIVRTSSTWTAPAKGWCTFVACGPSGSGAVAVASAATAARATGGSAGAWCLKQAYVNAGDAFTITIGTGGAQTQRLTPGTTNGNAGSGPTTISGPGVSMSAGAGLGGNASSVDSVAVSGPVGGSASGGDINVSGGDGGSISAITFAGPISTGGGCVNPQGRTSTKGGDVTSLAAAAGVSGGGGVGGKGADVTNSIGSGQTGGGGSDAAAVAGSGGVAPLLAAAGLYLGLMSFIGTGSNGGVNTTITDWGAGSGGYWNNTGTAASGAVAFGASGAAAGVGITNVSSGLPSWGGGSGGVAASSVGASGTFTAAKGADGFVVVVFHGGDR